MRDKTKSDMIIIQLIGEVYQSNQHFTSTIFPNKKHKKQILQIQQITPHMSSLPDKNQQMVSYIVSMTQKLSKAFKQINEMSVQFLQTISGNERSQRLRNRSIKEKQREKTKIKDQYDDLNSNLIDQDEEEEEQEQDVDGPIPKKKIKIKNRIQQAQEEHIQQPPIQQKGTHIKVAKKQQEPLKPDHQEKAQQKKKAVKPISHKPKAPTSSFLLFFKQQQQSIAKSYPNYGVVQLTKVAAKCWNDLSLQDKDPYQKLFEVERKKYKEEMEKYRKNFPEQVRQKELQKKEKKKKKAKQRRQKESTTSKNAPVKQKPVKAPVVNEFYFPQQITPFSVKLEEIAVQNENQQAQSEQNDQMGKIKSEHSEQLEEQIDEFSEQDNSLGEDV